jgi:hypothetical protein
MLTCKENAEIVTMKYGVNVKMSVKEKILAYLSKPFGWNTLSVAQAQARFGIVNVAARIHELREDGFPIYTNRRTRGDGSAVAVYRLGRPSRSMRAAARARGIRLQKVV